MSVDYVEMITMSNSTQSSITQTELATMMNKSRRSIQTIMKQLIDEGVIERVGSKRIGTWIVR